MHNGVVDSINLIRRRVLALLSQATLDTIQGTTDSELMAALFMSKLGVADWQQSCPVEHIAKTLEQTIATILALQRELVPRDKAEPNSLNVAVTDGVSMVAIRFRDHETQQPPSLYLSTTAGITLNRQFPKHPDGPDVKDAPTTREAGDHGAHIIVASEPSTYDRAEWQLIGKNELVLVDAAGHVARRPAEITF